MTYLLDTTVIIDHAKGNVSATDFISCQYPPHISVVTACELYQGTRDKRELSDFKQLMKEFCVIPIDERISQRAQMLMEHYHLSRGIGIPDACIAATAIKCSLVLVTANAKHFSPIKGLKVRSLPRPQVK